MQWSKLKQRIEQNFAPSTMQRVQIFTTRYTTGSHFKARAWICIDGQEVANFSPSEFMHRYLHNSPDIDQRVPDSLRNPENAVERGEFDKDEFHDACWEYLQLSIDEALAHRNPLIQSFAMLNKRLGKRRLRLIEVQKYHPLVQVLLNFRLKCESITPHQPRI